MRPMRKLVLLLAGIVLHGSAHAQPNPATGRIEGLAYDSVHARPLSRVAVQIAFASDPAVSRHVSADERGRFRIDSLLPGTWLLGATDTNLDSLGIEALTIRVDVKPKGATRAVLAVPSAKALITQMCGAEVARDSSGLLFGTLRDARNPAMGARGTVRVDWLDLELRGGRFVRTLRTLDASATSSGIFVACGVPPGGTLRVRASSDRDSSGVLETIVAEHGISRFDVMVGEARRVTTRVRTTAPDSGSDSVDVQVLRGTSSVTGLVLGKGGQPLANASVTVWGTGFEVTTPSDGRFALSSLPSGSHTVEIRAIGYLPERRIVALPSDEPTTVSVQLGRLTLMDTVKVRAMRRVVAGGDLAGFEARRRSGFGRFLDEEAIAKRQAFRTSDLLRTMSGIRVVPGDGGDRVMMRGDFRGNCMPTVYIDRMRMFDSDLDTFIDPSIIRGIEVYSPMFTPPEFMATSNCGSIVIWTGARRKQ